jgi:hypothetical protein
MNVTITELSQPQQQTIMYCYGIEYEHKIRLAIVHALVDKYKRFHSALKRNR